MALTHEEMLEKVKNRPTSKSVHQVHDFSDLDINKLSKLPPNKLIEEIAHSLHKAYKKNEKIRSLVKEDATKAKNNIYRIFYDYIEEIDDKLENPQTKALLEKRTRPVAEAVVKSFRDMIEKENKPVKEGPAKEVKPLRVAELKEFGIDGLIDASIRDEDVRESIREYRIETDDGLDEQNKKIERFRKSVEIARKRKPQERRRLLTDEEVKKYFSAGDKGVGVSSVAEITPDITEEETDTLVRNLLKSRKRDRMDLDKESKKDIILKLYNTILNKKEDAYKNPKSLPSDQREKIEKELDAIREGRKEKTHFIDKLRDKKYVGDLVEHMVRPRTRLELHKDDKGVMTEEERKKFEEKEEERQRLKTDDPGRVMEESYSMLQKSRNYEDFLKSIDFGDMLDKTLSGILGAMPKVGEIEDKLDLIEDQLKSLGIRGPDIPFVLQIEDGDLKRKYLQERVRQQIVELKETKEKLEKADSDKEKKKLVEKIKEMTPTAKRLIKLQKQDYSTIYNTVEDYLSYLRDSEDKLKNIEKELSKNISALKKAVSEAENLYKEFRDVSRQSEYRNRWSMPGALSDEEKKRLKKIKWPLKENKDRQKEAVDLKSYTSIYEKLRKDVEAAERAVSDLKEVLNIIKLKTLSIVEADSSKSDMVKSMGLKQDLKNNPYGGKGPKIEEVMDQLLSAVETLRGLDISKRISQAEKSLDKLRSVHLWVNPGKKQDKEARDLFISAQKIKKIANSIEAAQKYTPVPKGAKGYDISFYRTRPTAGGGVKSLPNFFIEDSTGLVKKIVEYLEKNWSDYTSDDPKKAQKAIDDAIEKVLKTKGSLEDYFNNMARQKITSESGLKKAREEIKNIKKIQSKTSEQLESLKEKYVPVMEKLIDFIRKPLDRLKVSLSSEKATIPEERKKIKPSVDRLKDQFKDLIKRTKDIKGKSGQTLLQKIKGEGEIPDLPKLPAVTGEKINEAKKNKSKDPVSPMSIEEAKELFIKKFNKAFKGALDSPLTGMPSDDTLREIVKKYESKRQKEAQIKKDKGRKDRDTRSPLELSRGVEKELRSPFSDKFEKSIREYEKIKKEKKEKKLNPEEEAIKNLVENINEIFFTDFPKDKIPKIDALLELPEKWVKGEKEYLEEYNKLNNRKENYFPSIEEIRDINKKIKSQKSLGKFEGLSKEEKDWLEDYNKTMGTDLSELPSIGAMKSHINTAAKKIRSSEKGKDVEKKEKALEFQSLEIPKSVQEAMKNVPKSVTDEAWFKEVQRDRSHHKTKWFDRAVQRMEDAPDKPEDFSRYLQSIAQDVSVALEEKRALQDIDPLTKTVKNNLENVMRSIVDAIRNNKNLDEVIDVNRFKNRVYFPAKNLSRAIEELKRLISSGVPLISTYKHAVAEHEKVLGEITEEDAKGETEEERRENFEKLKENIEDIKKRQKDSLNRISALLNALRGAMNEAVEKLNHVKTNIMPLFNDIIKEFNSPAYKKVTADLPPTNDVKEIEDVIRNMSKAYSDLLAVGEKAVQKGEKAVLKQSADSGDKSPYDIALETKGSKLDLAPIKDKPQAYKNIEKMISYLKNLSGKLKEDTKLGGPLSPEEIQKELEFFTEISENTAGLVKAMKDSLIPGLDKLLKQKVQIGGEEKIVTSLETAVSDLDKIMDEYSSKRTQLINRLDGSRKKFSKAKDAMRDYESLFDPETGEYVGFDEKEKKIITRFFLRQLYRALDQLWAQAPGRRFSVTGEREEKNYERIWRRFQEIAGAKSNRKILGILNSIKADIRKENKDPSSAGKGRIRFRSDELKQEYNRIKKRFEEVGENPNKSDRLKDLKKLIDWLEKKEKAVDKVFALMRQTSDLDYIKNIKDELRKKAEEIGPVEDENDIIQIPKGSEIGKEIKETVENFDEVLDRAEKIVGKEEDLYLKTQEVDEPISIDEALDLSQSMIDELMGEMPKERTSKASNLKYKYSSIFYSPLMQKTMKNLFNII